MANHHHWYEMPHLPTYLYFACPAKVFAGGANSFLQVKRISKPLPPPVVYALNHNTATQN
jgi:hypothetical protein